jgi:hypothetical protein
MTAGTASTSGSRSCESWVLAADRPTASGMPLASITRWYLEPGLPRSTGFAPVNSPTPREGGCDCLDEVQPILSAAGTMFVQEYLRWLQTAASGDGPAG